MKQSISRRMKLAVALLVTIFLVFSLIVVIRMLPAVDAQPQPSWSNEMRITDSAGDSRRVSLAIGPTGNMHIAFDDTSKGYPQIYYVQLDQNGNIIVPMTRVSMSADHAQRTDIAVDANNNAFIVWDEVTDGNPLLRNLYAAKVRGTDGSVLLRKRLVSDGSSLYPSIVVDRSSGEVLIVWQKRMGAYPYDTTEVFATKTDNNLNFVFQPSHWRIGYYSSGVFHPQIALGPGRIAHVVSDFGGTEYVQRDGIYGRFTLDGQPVGSALFFLFPGIIEYPTYGPINIDTPRLAVDTLNNVHFVFANPQGDVGYMKSLNGQVALAPRTIFIAGWSKAVTADVAVDDQNRARVVFNTNRGEIMYYVINTDGSILLQETLRPSFPALPEAPAIAFGNGKVYVVWNDVRRGVVNNHEIYLKIRGS